MLKGLRVESRLEVNIERRGVGHARRGEHVGAGQGVARAAGDVPRVDVIPLRQNDGLHP